MAYIRSGNNPEALYIWGDGETVTVVKGHITVGNIPSVILNGLIRKYVDEHEEEDCEYEGAVLSEVWVDSNDVELEKIEKDPTIVKGTGSNQAKTRLTYGDWSLIMWGVTWDWIAHNNYKRL